MQVIVGMAVLIALAAIEVVNPGAASAAEGDRLALDGTDVNVRTVPALEGDVVAVINPGETIIEVDSRNDWVYVSLPDRERRGWIYAPLLKRVAGTPTAALQEPTRQAPRRIAVTPRAQSQTRTEQSDPRRLSTAALRLRGDPREGEKVFYKCGSCHTAVPGVHGQGPSLHGIVGSRPASSGGFGYSQGLRSFASAGNVWDEETLDRFIQRPTRVVDGTSMPFSGVRNPQDRRNLIAYLQQLSR